MADLLPCPFCGSAPELIEAPTGVEDTWLVRCTGPHCQCKTLNHYGRDQSVFIWNKRIIPHVQRGRKSPSFDGTMAIRNAVEINGVLVGRDFT
jgi:hypothetical protein